ncbi:hypothetical protein GV64_04320 [Endozoicomonas elysicola]|uniref:Uncharacterized protein n=1 Tax=Endozoicomonas elysicola TaxID=305900 RepID=A0A081K7E6_9GAMM|nr:hypothetical protein GV64_04320 [Endozoicomonas elysicola]
MQADKNDQYNLNQMSATAQRLPTYEQNIPMLNMGIGKKPPHKLRKSKNFVSLCLCGANKNQQPRPKVEIQ